MEDLGKVIRERRGEGRLTLRDLARKTGFSPSYLSQIERGVITPSVSALRKIADAFGVTVGTLFDQAERPGTTQRKVVRRHERRIITYPGSKIENQLLAPDLRRKMEPFWVRARPGIKSPVYVHDGEEFAFVLKGTMTIWAGDERFVLKTGDAIYLESSVPHRWENSGRGDAVVLWVTTPPTW